MHKRLVSVCRSFVHIDSQKTGPVRSLLTNPALLRGLICFRKTPKAQKFQKWNSFSEICKNYIINLERPQCFSAIAPAVPAGMGTVPRIFPPAVKPEVSLGRRYEIKRPRPVRQASRACWDWAGLSAPFRGFWERGGAIGTSGQGRLKKRGGRIVQSAPDAPRPGLAYFAPAGQSARSSAVFLTPAASTLPSVMM